MRSVCNGVNACNTGFPGRSACGRGSPPGSQRPLRGAPAKECPIFPALGLPGFLDQQHQLLKGELAARRVDTGYRSGVAGIDLEFAAYAALRRSVRLRVAALIRGSTESTGSACAAPEPLSSPRIQAVPRPRASTFLAALTSRSCLLPHSAQVQDLTESGMSTLQRPQPLHTFEVGAH